MQINLNKKLWKTKIAIFLEKKKKKVKRDLKRTIRELLLKVSNSSRI